jgi:hypothetical protein
VVSISLIHFDVRWSLFRAKKRVTHASEGSYLLAANA